MSPNRRILLNIVATYGRSLYALVCGLFISRWVLAAVGKGEFGLNCGIGGMVVIVVLAYNEIGSRRKCRDGDFCYRDRPQESMEKWGLAGACPQGFPLKR